jgi:hypothetical protein
MLARYKKAAAGFIAAVVTTGIALYFDDHSFPVDDFWTAIAAGLATLGFVAVSPANRTRTPDASNGGNRP